jgi:hypothetical protein
MFNSNFFKFLFTILSLKFGSKEVNLGQEQFKGIQYHCVLELTTKV